ncbi:hypothetical protein EDB85DRAFT_1898885 [Lactarius pseudohatsudake]|nr:hypothetical protein EDB85DRAFT_1898885 [Lactarius pseudohatsudake]
MAYFKGRWHNVVRWRSAAPVSDGSGRFTPSSGGKAAHPMEWTTVIDLTPLQAVLKIVRPISRQLPSESRWLWESATSKLLSKEYREATRAKQVIEQRQWDKAANRERRGVEYFEKDIQSGVPTLMQAGREALEVEINLPTFSLPIHATRHAHPAPSTAAERQGDRQSSAASVAVTVINRVSEPVWMGQDEEMGNNVTIAGGIE